MSGDRQQKGDTQRESGSIRGEEAQEEVFSCYHFLKIRLSKTLHFQLFIDASYYLVQIFTRHHQIIKQVRFIIVVSKADYRGQILLVNLFPFLDYTFIIYAPASLFRAQMLKPQDIILILRYRHSYGSNWFYSRQSAANCNMPTCKTITRVTII